MDILEKALDYLDTEHKDFRAFISRQAYAPSIPSRDSERELIEMTRKATLDRGMGVVMFVQSLGVSYDDIKGPYEEFKEAINKLAEIGKRGIE
jgi:hypothetical protein